MWFLFPYNILNAEIDDVLLLLFVNSTFAAHINLYLYHVILQPKE